MTVFHLPQLHCLNIFHCRTSLAIFPTLPLANRESHQLEQSVFPFPTEIKCVISAVLSVSVSQQSHSLHTPFKLGRLCS